MDRAGKAQDAFLKTPDERDDLRLGLFHGDKKGKGLSVRPDCDTLTAGLMAFFIEKGQMVIICT